MSRLRFFLPRARNADGPTTEDEPAVAPGPAEPAAPGEDLAPSRMRGREEPYGYGVAAILGVAAVANLVVTKGKGAPVHPATTLSVLALLATAVMAATVRVRNRLLTPFLAVIAAFFVTLPKVPNSLSGLHVVALVVPVVYALWVTQRHKKAQGPRSRRGSRNASQGGASTGRPPRAKGRPATKASARSATPRSTSGRYTPPKSRSRRR